eukprot:COSAG01_NODE_2426_length_7722_cov_2.700905_11_plen_47_part_00
MAAAPVRGCCARHTESSAATAGATRARDTQLCRGVNEENMAVRDTY